MTRRVWMGLAAVVVAVLAVAWIAWPGTPKGVTLHTGTEHYVIAITVDRPRVGMTGLELAVTNRARDDRPESDAVTVEFLMPLMGHAMMPLSGVVSPRTRFDTVMLPMAGPWELTVTVTPPAGGAAERATVPLWVGGS